MRAQLYRGEQKALWDEFVGRSKNGTFLFRRDYMEYHRERFEDHSLFILNEKQEVVALLPANRAGETLNSHGGLTYGGFISSDTMKLPIMLQVFEATFDYLTGQDITKMVYKTVPFVYHRVPAEEDRFALALCDARLIRRAALGVTSRHERLPFQERRKRGAKKARQSSVVVTETADFAAYWEILQDRLSRAHRAQPVHTLAEIELLQERFPKNIRLFAAFAGDEMLAGVVVHESDLVARAQYIAASERGQEVGALDLIFTELLMNTFEAKPYFDFGTSDEQDGRVLNRGLIDQKEGYGARMVAHDHYEVQLSSWNPGLFLGAMT